MTKTLAILYILFTHPEAWIWCVEEYGSNECRQMTEEELLCLYESDGMEDCPHE